MTKDEKRVQEMARELDSNPELKKLMTAAMEIVETDPDAVRVATENLLKGKNYYTVPEAAAALGVHPNTIYHLEQRREIDYYKPGRGIRIPASEIERLKTERGMK